MPDQTTPAEFVKLRDQLALDLGAIVTDRAHARRSAEYLLASGLVPLDRIQARYEETHPEPEPEPELEPQAPKTVQRGENQSAIPVGTIYLDNDESSARWRLRKTATGWEWQAARTSMPDSWGEVSSVATLYYPLTLESAK